MALEHQEHETVSSCSNSSSTSFSNSPESKRFESFDQLIEPVDLANETVIEATNEAANEPVIEVIDLTTRNGGERGRGTVLAQVLNPMKNS